MTLNLPPHENPENFLGAIDAFYISESSILYTVKLWVSKREKYKGFVVGGMVAFRDCNKKIHHRYALLGPTEKSKMPGYNFRTSGYFYYERPDSSYYKTECIGEVE